MNYHIWTGFHRKGITDKELAYAELTAKDRISYYTISKSKIINMGLRNSGIEDPYESPTSIATAVKSCADKWKANIKVSLEEELNRGTRFSATLDEYTSKAHSRFMNLNLHRFNGKPIGLGMIRVRGSLPAERAAEMVIQKLTEFGIDEDCHIVAVICDGAPVMQKMGRSFLAFQQLCMAHGIHLAVCDLLYEKPRKKKNNRVATARLSDAFQTVSGTDSENDQDDQSDIDEEDIEENSYEIEIDPQKIVFLPEVEALIQKVRKIVKIFTYSPVNNNILQAEVVRLP